MKRKQATAILLALLMFCLVGSAGHAAIGQDHVTILLVGQDEAAERTLEIGESAWGRADAIIVATLSRTTGDVRMLSVDRDWRVSTPEQGDTKLCLVNYLGGPERLVREVNALLGLDVSLYAMVSKGDMGKIVDSMGGVEVIVDAGDLAATGLRQTGLQRLTGAQAVAYMGTREQDLQSGDVERNERQRVVLEAIMGQVFATGMQGMLTFAEAVMPLMETNVTLKDIIDVASVVAAGNISRPRQERSPREADRLKTFAGAHDVVYVADMPAEIARVQAFLYAE